MRRPARGIQIFSLSALDVLAMTTGVFVLLLVLLMPYYRKTFDAHDAIEAARAAAAAASAAADERDDDRAAVLQAATGRDAAIERLEAEIHALEQQIGARSQLAPVALPEGEASPVIDTLDLVFVIDTTASMRPVIRELASSMRGIVRILERMVPSVRVGVVSYKDRDSDAPVTALLPLTPTDPHLARIIAFVERLERTTASSRTVEEDVQLGLEAAMALRFRPKARQTLVLIGDAEVHRAFTREVLQRTERFVAAAAGRSLSTLFVTTPSSLARGNQARAFFEQVAAAGKGSFTDHAGSMTESVLLSVLSDPPVR
jgi:hypothetical protein